MLICEYLKYSESNVDNLSPALMKMEVISFLLNLIYSISPSNMKFVGVLEIARLEKFRRGMVCDGMGSIKWRPYNCYEDLIGF